MSAKHPLVDFLQSLPADLSEDEVQDRLRTFQHELNGRDQAAQPRPNRYAELLERVKHYKDLSEARRAAQALSRFPLPPEGHA